MRFPAPCHSELYSDVRNARIYAVDYVTKRPSSNTGYFMEIFNPFVCLTLLSLLQSYTQYSRSEKLRKFWNVLLEKDGEDQFFFESSGI